MTTKTNSTTIMANFNAKVVISDNNNEKCTGKFGCGVRNDRGERLVQFATYKNLKIVNTFFNKKPQRWTWKSPGGRTKNEIDYFLTDTTNKIKDINAINKVNVGSDHRLVKCKFIVNTELE